jgi:hypothetical protein
LTGIFLPSATPEAEGPRNEGQFCARLKPAQATKQSERDKRRFIMFLINLQFTVFSFQFSEMSKLSLLKTEN